jgi:hypothetical protein
MPSYVTSRDGQRITARKIREALEAIPAPEPKINLALRLLADAYRYGVLDACPSGEGSPYAGYVTQLLGLHSRSALEGMGCRFYFRKNKKFADALACMADYALDD